LKNLVFPSQQTLTHCGNRIVAVIRPSQKIVATNVASSPADILETTATSPR